MLTVAGSFAGFVVTQTIRLLLYACSKKVKKQCNDAEREDGLGFLHGDCPHLLEHGPHLRPGPHVFWRRLLSGSVHVSVERSCIAERLCMQHVREGSWHGHSDRTAED